MSYFDDLENMVFYKSRRYYYKYYITYNGNNNAYAVDYSYIYVYSNIYFKNKEDAIAVINNPNFRDILDAVYKY